MISFSELIKEKRIAKQLSINALAKQSGLDPSYVMRMEKGTNKQPSFAITMKLAKELEITYEELAQAFNVESLGYDTNNKLSVQADINVRSRKDIAGIMTVINDMKEHSGTSIESIINLLSEVNKLIKSDKYIFIGTTDYTPFIVQLECYDYSIREFLENVLIKMKCNSVIIIQGELEKGDSFNFNDFISYILKNEIIDEDEAEEVISHYSKIISKNKK